MEHSSEEGGICTQEVTHVEEADELLDLVSHVPTTEDVQAAGAAFRRYHSILEKYHEQAQLLDPHVGPIVDQLTQVIRREALSSSGADWGALREASTFLWALITVRGYKAVVKSFSTEVADLEPVLALLCRKQVEGTERHEGDWQADCVLLLWLSQLLLIPFDLAAVDSSIDASASPHRDGEEVPLAEQLRLHCQGCLAEAGPKRDTAGVLLGRLLMRADCQVSLQHFVSWAAVQLQRTDPVAIFLVPGITRALVNVQKYGQRARMLPMARQIWPAALQLQSSTAAASNALSRKLAIKLVQRIGLTLLLPRTAAWRYQRQCLDIQSTLAGTATTGLGPGNALQGGASALPEQQGEASIGVQACAASEDEADGEWEVPDELEAIIGILLEGLADKDTVVRWSAAKGLGRIAGRLSKEMADEVLDSIAESFRYPDQDTAWHGGCLALAEVARRGLLLPHRVPELAPLMATALQYDLRRGAHSVGSHVRDAAAYVCWAFARAYESDIIAPAVRHLAPALLAVACYDREVNCRRAASAAFQESVGRLGNFPHGIDIVAAANYFSLASRQHAYLHVGPQVSCYPEYREVMVQHLIGHKLGHWDRALRELTSKALAAIVPQDPAYFSSSVLGQLLDLCADPCIEVLHGALLGTAELLLAVQATASRPEPAVLQRAVAVPQKLGAAKLFRGRGGELLRAGVCRLAECVALCQIPLSAADKAALLAVVDENLCHPAASIQDAAAAALHALARSYMEEGNDSMAEKHIKGLSCSKSPATRQGSAAALRVLPSQLLMPCWREAIAALGQACQVETDPSQRDAESRAAAVRTLASVAHELFSSKQGEACAGRGDLGMDQAAILERDVIGPLLQAACDYCTDDRGDVGSWVREAAVIALPQMLLLWWQHARADAAEEPAHAEATEQPDNPVLKAVVGALLRQAAERLDRLQKVAVEQLSALMAQGGLPRIPDRMSLSIGLARSWRLYGQLPSDQVTQDLVPLLWSKAYGKPVLEGLVASIGGLDGRLRRSVSAAMAKQLAEGSVWADEQREELASSFAAVWSKHANSARLALPLLRTANVLYDDCGMHKLPESHPFPGQLLELVKGEARGCKDVACLTEASAVLCHLASLHTDVSKQSLRALLVLLCNRFPKVRKAVAENLYVWLLTQQDSHPGLEGLSTDAACDVLCESVWDGSLQEAKIAREALYSLLQLPPTPAVKQGAGGAGESKAMLEPLQRLSLVC